jgi:hypothetical protein
VSLLATVDKLLSVGEGIEVHGRFVGEHPMNCKTVRFCGRIFIYSEEDLPESELGGLSSEAEANGLYILF